MVGGSIFEEINTFDIYKKANTVVKGIDILYKLVEILKN